MNKVILAQNRHWDGAFEGLYKRDVFKEIKENIDTKHIQVLQGIRRGGKSTLFKLLINHLMESKDPKEILYLNLDDPFFIQYSRNPSKLYEVIQTAQKLTNKEVAYLFLDEVQAIEKWESYVKSVYDSQLFKKIFITGSNASLLSGNLATLLTGRYISTKVHPLSFQEIMKINKIESYLELNKNIPKVLNIIDDMMHYGSFVEVYDAKESYKREILKSYYETILLKDCVSNNEIRDIKGFKELSFYLITNLTALYSYASLSKATNLHDKSVKEYISYLEESYLFKELKLFSYPLKEQQNNKKKLYLSDNGFMNLGFSFSSNSGKLFENLVFSEFEKRGFELYFYHKTRECDFVFKKEKEIIAVQVCFVLSDQNRDREINGLLKLPFHVKEKILITYNQNEESEEIKIVSFWDYFFHH